jgi:hypothetical protein
MVHMYRTCTRPCLSGFRMSCRKRAVEGPTWHTKQSGSLVSKNFYLCIRRLEVCRIGCVLIVYWPNSRCARLRKLDSKCHTSHDCQKGSNTYRPEHRPESRMSLIMMNLRTGHRRYLTTGSSSPPLYSNYLPVSYILSFLLPPQ